MPNNVACLGPPFEDESLPLVAFFDFLPEDDSAASTLSKKLSLFWIEPRALILLFVVTFGSVGLLRDTKGFRVAESAGLGFRANGFVSAVE